MNARLRRCQNTVCAKRSWVTANWHSTKNVLSRDCHYQTAGASCQQLTLVKYRELDDNRPALHCANAGQLIRQPFYTCRSSNNRFRSSFFISSFFSDLHSMLVYINIIWVLIKVFSWAIITLPIHFWPSSFEGGYIVFDGPSDFFIFLDRKCYVFFFFFPSNIFNLQLLETIGSEVEIAWKSRNVSKNGKIHPKIYCANVSWLGL